MSIKHIKDYYEQICNDYHEIIETLHELEVEAQNSIVPPERVENLEKLVKPMKDNYERWSYMIFLLNMPNKKEKQKKYKKQFQKTIDEFEKENDIKAMHKENMDCRDDLKKAFK